MFFLRRPTPAQALTFLKEQRQQGYTYPDVGESRDGLRPDGYNIDHRKARLGSGEACFEAARTAMRAWRMFETPWIRLTNPQAPFQVGETLVVQVKHLGFYSLVPDRVVYTIDEPGRFGFAYGTLSGHAEQGEERFLVTHDLEEDGSPNKGDAATGGTVRFELFAFSRPRHPLARLGAPAVRLLQRAAAHAYTEAMRRAIGEQT
ncbi:DUF1990 family protein [Deinococcus sp. UYEF24]